MPPKRNDGAGCVGFGCLGTILGALIASALLAHTKLDQDSQSFGMLGGAIPGGLIGGALWFIYKASRRRP
jgi:hypothetical protein